MQMKYFICYTGESGSGAKKLVTVQEEDLSVTGLEVPTASCAEAQYVSNSGKPFHLSL